MDQLQHDPLTKQQIQEAIYKMLYDPIHEHNLVRLHTLIVRNTLMCGYTHKSFVYKGQHYSADLDPAPLRQNRLNPALRGEMDSYLKDIERINNQEIPYVLGFITQTLNATNNFTDYFSIFPESIHHPLKELMKTCPCQQGKLSSEAIEALKVRNARGIQLLKERLTLNLLL